MFNVIYYKHMGRCLARCSSESHIVLLSIFLLSVPF